MKGLALSTEPYQLGLLLVCEYTRYFHPIFECTIYLTKSILMGIYFKKLPMEVPFEPRPEIEVLSR